MNGAHTAKIHFWKIHLGNTVVRHHRLGEASVHHLHRLISGRLYPRVGTIAWRHQQRLQRLQDCEGWYLLVKSIYFDFAQAVLELTEFF
jgi:hypothetical protein